MLVSSPLKMTVNFLFHFFHLNLEETVRNHGEQYGVFLLSYISKTREVFMDLIKKSEIWRAEHYNSKLFSLLRFLLGVLLIYKSIYFIRNAEKDFNNFFQSAFPFGSIALIHYIVLAHFAGGIMITLGFLTRIAVLFQIPILLGAILFVNASRGVFTMYSEFGLSILVFLMLLFFLYYGSGVYSADNALRRKKFYE